MSWIDSMTPKDTEEVKPGLFIQKKLGKYRQVHPAAWNGKINWNIMILGANPIKHLFIFGLIIFLAWSFQDGTTQYREFYEDVRSDPIGFCAEVRNALDVTCTKQDELSGLCNRNIYSGGLNLNNIEVVNEDT